MIYNQIVQSFDILNRISKVSSTKSKQDILSEGKCNTVLKSLLSCAYNPYRQYNIKKIPVGSDSCVGTGVRVETFNKFLNILVKLNKREITGNHAVQLVSDFLSECCPDEYMWYSRVLQKDLKIGMADKTINKVFMGLIPTYDVLLADKINPDDLNLDTPRAMKMLPNRMVVQYKIDGYRLNIYVSDSGDVSIRTRNGKTINGYSMLECEAAEKLPRGYVYDGEIVSTSLFDWIDHNAKNRTGAVIANRDLFSDVMSHAFSKEDNKCGIFNVFDMIPIDEWRTHKTTESYETRLHRINTLSSLDLSNIVVVPTSRVYYKNKPEDVAEIVNKFHQFLEVGWEGLMIKDLDSVYEFKRSKTLLKMKLMDTIDLIVVDVYEGTGKYKNMLGGVYVDYLGYRVGVGSGWTDAQRQYFWSHKNDIVGKTIEISYQAISKNKDGGQSLSFPVFKRVRNDK